MASPNDKDSSLDATIVGTTGVGVVRAFAKTQRDSGLHPGETLGRYEIVKTLGEGGMGAVYQARDTELDRMVALKIIKPSLADEPAILQRFRQELILARQITHKNIVRIYDLGEADGVKFITMEYVDGEDLRTIMRREGKLAPADAALIVRQMLEGLVVAHEEGIVHRDLKPGNVMRDANGRIVIMDFGLAHSDASSGMTQTGEMLGTVEYMSPEQAQGKPPDRRSDLFTVGLIFYELLTGKIPFEADTVVASLVKRSQERAVPVSEIEITVPPQINGIVSKCLETDPARRYQDANEIIRDLNHWLGSPKSTFIPNRITIPYPTRSWPIALATVFGVVFLAVIGWYFGTGRTAAPQHHVPVSVLVADFQNHTGDPIFDGTMEPMFNVALEGASFVNAFNRGEARKVARQVNSDGGGKLDEHTARLVAASQGLGAIVTGSLSRSGGGYTVSVSAIDGLSGKSIASAQADAATKDEVLTTIPKLAVPIRKALGDSTPESAQIAATLGTFSTTSLEAVHQYGVGAEQQFAGKIEDALKSFSEAARIDPSFARAYVGMGATARNLGRREDAQNYLKLAMEHVDRMTDRERSRTRGLYYATVGDYARCVDEYSALVTQYPADNGGHNNLAACYANLHNMSKAFQEARNAVEIAPKSAMQRMNYALYASYSGDFQTGEREARNVLQINPAYEKGYLTLADAQMGAGKPTEAAETYNALSKISKLGASLAAAGLADVALYEGRFSDAVRILEQGAAADLAANYPERAADKYATLGYVRLQMQQPKLAAEAATQALSKSKKLNLRYLAARVYAEAGDAGKARTLSAGLAAELRPEAKMYAKLVDGQIALHEKNASAAIQLFTDANAVRDTWIGHLALGQAYLAAGMFVEADSEFDICNTRRGEAVEFLDDGPTFGYFPALLYYQGRVREGLKSPGAADSYRQYLAVRGGGGQDPLLADVRERLGH
jgi:eukaryotic-like serine/threonine-protein kinase